MEQKKTNRLEYWINQVTQKIKNLDPDATIAVSKDTYEQEDVDIEVRTSSKLRQRISTEMAEFTSDILADEGYHILVLVLSKDQKKSRISTS